MTWLHWSLLSALFAGITAILAKLGVGGTDANLAAAIRTGVILVFTTAVAAATNPVSAVTQLSRQTWLALLLSGTAAGASWLCYFRALQLGPASRVAPIDKLSVVFVVVFAAVFLKEPFTILKALGAVLIALGAVLVAR